MRWNDGFFTGLNVDGGIFCTALDLPVNTVAADTTLDPIEVGHMHIISITASLSAGHVLTMPSNPSTATYRLFAIRSAGIEVQDSVAAGASSNTYGSNTVVLVIRLT